RKARMVVPLVGANYRAPRQPIAAVPAVRSEGIEPEHDEGFLDDSHVNERHPEVSHPTSNRVSTAATGNGSKQPEPAAVSTTAASANVNAVGGGGVLLEALRVVHDGLRGMQALQQQTAEAHQRFLEGQALAHRTFQSMMEG